MPLRFSQRIFSTEEWADGTGLFATVATLNGPGYFGGIVS